MLHLAAEHRHVLLGKIKRSVRRIVPTSSLIKLPESHKFTSQKKKIADLDLGRLTIDKSKELKRSRSDKSARSYENKKEDLSQELARMSLSEKSARGKSGNNPYILVGKALK